MSRRNDDDWPERETVTSEQPMFIKTIEIYEKFIKKDNVVYIKWKFVTEKRWHYKKTAFTDYPFVALNMPHPLVLPEGKYVMEVTK